ncbi:MAG: FHA domain-containing protein [Planctomycetaceae bacterium]|nr:FHA domain-containing protein [Planctomycetaceae bacterium]
MHVELIVGNKRSSVRRLVIRESALLGRSTKCDIRVVSDDISREHCRLEVAGTELILVDLGSTNGSFVDGTKVEAHQQISVSSGVAIQIGPAVFKVSFIHDEFEETHHKDDEDTVGELPPQSQEEADQTISMDDEFLAGIVSDAIIPKRPEDNNFDDFLKNM